jgi:hypothetical protein
MYGWITEVRDVEGAAAAGHVQATRRRVVVTERHGRRRLRVERCHDDARGLGQLARRRTAHDVADVRGRRPASPGSALDEHRERGGLLDEQRTDSRAARFGVREPVRFAAASLIETVLAIAAVRDDEHARVGIVELAQLLQRGHDRLMHAEARIGQDRHFLEQRQPPLQPALQTAPVGNHVAEHEEIQRTQQKSI